MLLAALVTLSPGLSATVAFHSAVKYQVGTNPVAATAADFNGDGHLDLAVVNSGSNDVSVLLANADGTFQPAQNFALNSSSANVVASVAAGDFNGDGKPDIAVFLPSVSDSTPGEVRILMGNGDGTFEAPIATRLNLQPASGNAVVDVNGDKKADLIVSLFDPNNQGALSLNVLTGNGDGTFGDPKVIVSGAQALVAVTDFNKDAKPDLGVSDDGGPQTLLGNGDGTFRIGTTIIAADGMTVSKVWSADLNGDGNMDLIVESGESHCARYSCNDTQHLSVFLSSGGTFGHQQMFFQGGSSKDEFNFGTVNLVGNLVVGDFDGDGKVDVMDRRTTSGFPQRSNTVLELRAGKGDGTFAPNNATFDPTLVLPDVGPMWIAQDLNGDQLTDLVVPDLTTANAVAVILNDTPSFSMKVSTTALNVEVGQQVTDTLSIATHNGFSSSIQLSCKLTGTAPLPTCSFSPSEIQAGATSATSTLTVTAPSNLAALGEHSAPWRSQRLPALSMLVGFLGICLPVKRSQMALKRSLWTASLFLIGLVAVGCGSGTKGAMQQAAPQIKSYTVTVTATSDTTTKTLPISLTAH